MNRRRREELEHLKEYVGTATRKIKVGDKGDGQEVYSEMPAEEAEEYIKLSEAANLKEIKNILTYIAIILSIPIVIGVGVGIWYLCLTLFG